MLRRCGLKLWDNEGVVFRGGSGPGGSDGRGRLYNQWERVCATLGKLPGSAFNLKKCHWGYCEAPAGTSKVRTARPGCTFAHVVLDDL